MLARIATVSVAAGLLAVSPQAALPQSNAPFVSPTPPPSAAPPGDDQPARIDPVVIARFNIRYPDSTPARGAEVRFLGRDYSGIPIDPEVVQTDNMGNGTATLVARPTRYSITAHGDNESTGWAGMAVAPGADASFGITLHDPYDPWAPEYWRYAIFEGFGLHRNYFVHRNWLANAAWRRRVARAHRVENVVKQPSRHAPPAKGGGSKSIPAEPKDKPLAAPRRAER